MSERHAPPLQEVPSGAAGDRGLCSRPGGAGPRAGRGLHAERGNPGPAPRPTGRSGGVTGRGRGSPHGHVTGPARGSDPGPAVLALPSPPAAAALGRPSLGRGGPGAGVRRGELRAAPAPRPSAPGPPAGSRPPSLPSLPALRGARAARRRCPRRDVSPTPAASPASPQCQPSLRSCRVPARPWMQRRGPAGGKPDRALSRSRLPRCDQRSGCPARARFYSNFRGFMGRLDFFGFLSLGFLGFFPQILKLSNVF